MPTTRSRTGERTASDRRHVGLSVPRGLKQQMKRAADVLEWSVGDWVLAAAAEQGHLVVDAGGTAVRRRSRVRDAAFCALYLSADERDELDELATRANLNRSAFVTAVARLQLGADLAPVLAELRGEPPEEGP